MDSAKDNARPVLGFMTVVEHPQHGLFGGYLLLNFAARPIEFHCTAPVKPNRAQQILYGATLEPFLYGEQIGVTLLEHAKVKPRLVFTDRPPMLALREMVDLPVALIQSKENEDAKANAESIASGPGGSGSDARDWRVDQAHAGPRLLSFELGRNRLAVAERMSADRDSIVRQLSESIAGLDLAEPFQRIREAIEEAQQAVR